MSSMFSRLFFIIAVFLLSANGVLAAVPNNTLPIPRFVSIKSSEANMRAGPNVRYPIQWVFVKKGEPVEVIAEFEQWRKIRDKQGDQAWIHESMLSGRRHVIIIGNKPQVLYKKDSVGSGALLRVEPEVRGELLSCEKDWCRVKIAGEKGWMEKKTLWGVYPSEVTEH